MRLHFAQQEMRIEEKKQQQQQQQQRQNKSTHSDIVVVVVRWPAYPFPLRFPDDKAAETISLPSPEKLHHVEEDGVREGRDYIKVRWHRGGWSCMSGRRS